MKKYVRFSRVLRHEQLESRCVLSGITGAVASADIVDDYHAVIVAGDPSSDSPGDRVDPNTTASPFAGVGSIQIATSQGSYICTGTPIDATHVLTAGHCVDLNNDGRSNDRDNISGVTFNLNYGGNLTSQIPALSWTVNPSFSGFNRPLGVVNDDLAILTLSSPLPDGVPVYSRYAGSLDGATLDMVGYGLSGDGVNGYTVNPSWTVKRTGQNVVDAFYGQDDRKQPTGDEVFRFDFDAPDGSSGPLGGPSLGNDLETTLGGGDSGGPSFVNVGGEYQLAGVNTFTQGSTAPLFGSMGGGMVVGAYEAWISAVLAGTDGDDGGGGKGGGNGGGKGGGKGAKSVVEMVEFASVPSAVVGSLQVSTASESVLRSSDDFASSQIDDTENVATWGQDANRDTAFRQLAREATTHTSRRFTVDSITVVNDGADDLLTALDSIFASWETA